MELRENESYTNFAKFCGNCNRNTLLPYEDEWTCTSCRFNLIKRKHEFSKVQGKKSKLVF